VGVGVFEESLVFRLEGDVVTAPAVCGLLTVPDFLRQVQGWCVAGGPALVIDLSPVRDTGMTMLRALLIARRQCRARGRDLHVVEPRPGVLPAHAEALLRSLVPFHPDLATATACTAPRPELRPVA
jgi:hypothetical protein